MSKTSPERRLRFSVEQDLQLLREVIRQNPFEDIDKWKEIHENFVNECNIPFSLRTCKDHCNHLLNLYLKDNLKIKPKESPQEFSKKKRYLEEILNLRKNCSPDNMPSNVSTDKNDDFKMVLKDESKDTSRIDDDDDDDFYWKDEEDIDQESRLKKQTLALQERKLALRERRLKLEEEKLELDKFERTKRMEMEKIERDMYRRVLMQNQTIITALVDKLNKKNGNNLCLL